LIWYFDQAFPTTPQAYIQNGVSNWPLVWAPRLHLFVYFSLKGHTFTKINPGLIFTKNDARLKLVWFISDFSQVFPTTSQTCIKNGSSSWLLVGAPRPHWFILIKGLAFTKIDARLKPVHWLILYFGQAFHTTSQAYIQNGVSNWPLVWAPRLHLFIFIKGLAFTKIDTRLKPVHWLIWFFSQAFPTATQAYIKNGVSNWPLVWAPRLHLFFSFSLKGHTFTKIYAGLILTKNDARLKLVLWLTSDFSHVFSTTSQTFTKNGSSNWLLVGAPHPHWFMFIKGLAFTKIFMPGSNRYTDWSDIFARSSPQHPRHVPKMASWSGYWLELPVFICFFLFSLKGHTFPKIYARLILTKNDAGLKLVLWLTSYFSQVFPTTPQTCT
jgi:hypothetical protein